MPEHDTRVGLVSIGSGTIVAVAVTGALGCGIAAAAVASGADLTVDTLRSQTLAVGLLLGVVLAVGAFLGGRVAAVTLRALVRRDGVIVGLVTGSAIAILVLIGAAAVAGVWPASRAADLLGAIAGAEIVCIFAGMIGGARGARSEARYVGLKTVHVAKRGFSTSSAESYERDFFEGDSMPRPHA
jgi:hypothetical protein